MAMARLRAAFNPLLEVLPTLGLVGMLCVGGRQVIDGKLSVAALITFNFYILQLVFPLRMTSFMVAQISRAARVGDARVTRSSPPTPRSSNARMRGRCPTDPASCASKASRSATARTRPSCGTST